MTLVKKSKLTKIIENGARHSLFGWIKITDQFNKDIAFQLLRYKNYHNEGESVDPIFANIFKMRAVFSKSDGKTRFQLLVAKGAGVDDLKPIVKSFQFIHIS